MDNTISNHGRRKFLKTTTVLTIGFTFLGGLTSKASIIKAIENKDLQITGGEYGQVQELGTLVSFRHYNKEAMIKKIKEATNEHAGYLSDRLFY